MSIALYPVLTPPLVSRAALSIGLACTGFLVVSPDWVGFWSKSLALRDVRYRLPTATIRAATPVSFAIPVFGLQLEIEGHANLRFRFRSEQVRDDALRRVRAAIAPSRSRTPSLTDASASSSASSVHTAGSAPSDGSRPHSPASPRPAPPRSQSSLLAPLSRTFSEGRRRLDPSKVLAFPKAVNVPLGTILRMPARHFVCLTIGSRGDVQPYIALGLGLKAEGHTVTIVTHEEYKAWIEGFGLRHRAAGGDPGALMKLSVENKVRVY